MNNNCTCGIYPEEQMRYWEVSCSCNNSGGGDLDNYYNKQQTDARIKRAKDEVEAEIADLARDVEEIASGVADTYSKEETDTKLALKANISDVYDKTAVDGLLSTKASTATTDALSGAIDSKQDLSGMSAYTLTSTTNSLSGTVTGHIADQNIHVSATDKNNWNNKLDPSALNGYATEQWVGQQGYLTGYTESDPIFTSSPAYGITNADKTTWNGAATNASNAISQLNGYSLLKISKSAFDALTVKNPTTIYLVYQD